MAHDVDAAARRLERAWADHDRDAPPERRIPPFRCPDEALSSPAAYADGLYRHLLHGTGDPGAGPVHAADRRLRREVRGFEEAGMRPGLPDVEAGSPHRRRALASTLVTAMSPVVVPLRRLRQAWEARLDRHRMKGLVSSHGYVRWPSGAGTGPE